MALAAARECLDGQDLAAARALLEPFAASTHQLELLVVLCRIRITLGDLDAALDLLQRARTLHPAAAVLLKTAAFAHEMKGQAPEALDCWQKLVLGPVPPTAVDCVKWMQAFVRAAKLRPGLGTEVVARVQALLQAAPDRSDALHLEFFESMYQHEPLATGAARAYRAISPPPGTHVDADATWRTPAAWARSSGARLVRDTDAGPPAEDTTLIELQDTLIAPGLQWIPILDHGTVVLDGFVMHRTKLQRELSDSPALLTNKHRLALRLERSPRVIEQPAFLLGGMPQYYHHTVEFLSTLAIAERLGAGATLPLVMNAELAPFQREQLALLGVPPEQLILVAAHEQVLCRRLLVPSRLVRGGRWIHPLVPRWHRRRLAPSGADHPPTLKLYLSRRLAQRRRITNEAALADLLTALGYRTVSPESLGVAEQIALFSRASHVVAPAGAALTNMLYMPPGGSVRALASTYAMNAPGDRYFDALATACGHRFAWHTGEPSGFPGERLIDADFVVDLGELRAAVERDG